MIDDHYRILNKPDEEVELQRERTLRGCCARCGSPPAGHIAGSCCDGGSYTWAHSPEDMQRLISNLEKLLGKDKS